MIWQRITYLLTTKAPRITASIVYPSLAVGCFFLLSPSLYNLTLVQPDAAQPGKYWLVFLLGSQQLFLYEYHVENMISQPPVSTFGSMQLFPAEPVKKLLEDHILQM